MPWIPFGKFILPLCQLSLIYAKAVRQHYWFRRLTHTIHGVGVILLLSNKRSIQKGVTRQLLSGSWWKDPSARQTGEHWTNGLYFNGATGFGHCARAMHKSNMRENLQPTSEAPVKSRTHPPTWLQAGKKQCTRNSAHAEFRARENIGANRLYDIFSDTGFKQCNCTCRSLQRGTWCVLLNDIICPPPWEHTHLGKSPTPNNRSVVSPGAWQQAVLHVGRGRSRVSHAAGMWGLWSLLGAGRRHWNMVWHMPAGGSRWKANFCPWACRRLGQSTQHGGQKRAGRSSWVPWSFSGAWSWRQAFPNSFFLSVSDFPGNHPQPLLRLSSKQLPACPRNVHKGSGRQQHPCTAKPIKPVPDYSQAGSKGADQDTRHTDW